MFDSKEYAKRYYIQHKEKIKERSKNWGRNNPEKRKKISREYRRRHPEIAKEWREKNSKRLKEYSKRYHKDNSERINQYVKQYYRDNSGRVKKYQEVYRKDNPEKIKERYRRYYENNYQKMKEKHRQYCSNNLERVRKYKRQWIKIKCKTDLKFCLNHRISKAIRRSLRGTKNDRHWEDLVGWNVKDLEKRLIKTMPKGYTWKDFKNGKLHIDHIIPVSAFNFFKPEHIDFKRCWALKNLRLLPAEENLAKKDKLVNPFQPALLLESF